LCHSLSRLSRMRRRKVRVAKHHRVAAPVTEQHQLLQRNAALHGPRRAGVAQVMPRGSCSARSLEPSAFRWMRITWSRSSSARGSRYLRPGLVDGLVAGACYGLVQYSRFSARSASARPFCRRTAAETATNRVAVASTGAILAVRRQIRRRELQVC